MGDAGPTGSQPSTGEVSAGGGLPGSGGPGIGGGGAGFGGAGFGGFELALVGGAGSIPGLVGVAEPKELEPGSGDDEVGVLLVVLPGLRSVVLPS